MEMIRKGKTGEGNRVRDFADMCFFTETSEERFETLLPKLYKIAAPMLNKNSSGVR